MRRGESTVRVDPGELVAAFCFDGINGRQDPATASALANTQPGAVAS